MNDLLWQSWILFFVVLALGWILGVLTMLYLDARRKMKNQNQKRKH